MKAKPITVMGIFVVDLAFRTKALPVWGETVMGAGFRLGPGGKGSNQSVAAARLGAKVFFISKVGEDGVAKYKITGTPTLVINGHADEGFEQFFAHLDAALAGK